MRKIVTSFLPAIVCILLAACGGSARNSAAVTQTPGSAFTVHLSDSLLSQNVPDTIRLGNINHGETVLRDIVFANEGGTPVVITGLDLTCGCISADYPKQPIMPGERAVMTIRFDSRGIYGWVFKSMLVFTSLNDRPHTIVVTGEVRR